MTPSDGARLGQLWNSVMSVQFALAEVAPGDGGFCCIPGPPAHCAPVDSHGLSPALARLLHSSFVDVSNYYNHGYTIV
jgi:hypothetical protein